MTPTTDTLRRIQSVLAPLTGARATGIAHVRATGDDVLLAAGSFAAPVLVSDAGNAQVLRNRLLLVVGDHTITSAGVDVPIVGMLGGPGYDFADGTELVWDPPVTGVELRSTVLGDMTPGVAAEGECSVRRIVSYEEIDPGTASENFWNAVNVGMQPSVVVCWDSTAQARAVNYTDHIQQDIWSIYVVTSRMHGLERAHEGLAILDACIGYLTQRQAVDGVVFSSPTPTQIRGRKRLDVSASAYIYGAALATESGVRRLDPRVTPALPAGTMESAPWSLWNKVVVELDHQQGDEDAIPVATSEFDVG